MKIFFKMTITNSYWIVIKLFIKACGYRNSTFIQIDDETSFTIKQRDFGTNLSWKIWLVESSYLILSLYKTLELLLCYYSGGKLVLNVLVTNIVWDILLGVPLVFKLFSRTKYHSNCIILQHNLLVSYEQIYMKGNGYKNSK